MRYTVLLLLLTALNVLAAHEDPPEIEEARTVAQAYGIEVDFVLSGKPTNQRYLGVASTARQQDCTVYYDPDSIEARQFALAAPADRRGRVLWMTALLVHELAHCWEIKQMTEYNGPVNELLPVSMNGVGDIQSFGDYVVRSAELRLTRWSEVAADLSACVYLLQRGRRDLAIKIAKFRQFNANRDPLHNSSDDVATLINIQERIVMPRNPFRAAWQIGLQIYK